jgi:hypothetical protein
MATDAEKIEFLTKQVAILAARLDGNDTNNNQVEYPAKPGEAVLMPADASGKRRIRKVPNEELGIANLFAVPGIELFHGEIPECGFIMDDPKQRIYQAPQSEQPTEAVKILEEIKTTKPKVLAGKERVAAITAAILALKKDDFNKSGYPGIAALTQIVGFQVEAKERDEAFEKFTVSQPEWEMPEE